MKQLPTAKEIAKNWGVHAYESGEPNNDVMLAMIEFAKLHVKAALENAAENVMIKKEYYYEEDVGRTRLREILDSSNLASERTDGEGIIYAVDTYEVNKESILNAYSLENIK